MRELRSYGSVRGAISDDRPYRDPRQTNSNSLQPTQGQFKSHLQGNLQRHKNLTRQSLCTGNFGCL